MQQELNEDKNFTNNVLTVWDFAKTIKPGDVVYAKRGKKQIVGRGIVKSDYIFDDSRNNYKHIHKIDWTNNQECDYLKIAPNKTLTDISTKTDIINYLEAFYKSKIKQLTPQYSDKDFLDEVFMSGQNPKYDALITKVQLLNKAIAEDPSLGLGFRIGHSYFCTNELVDDSWLSSVVEYELIPLLFEYWFDEPSKVESWSEQLRGAII